MVSEKKVRFLGPYKPEYKIHSSIQDSGAHNLVEVISEDEKLNNRFPEIKLTKTGERIWRVNISYSEAERLAHSPEVNAIYPAPKGFEPHNDRSRQLLDVDSLHQASDNITGDGFTAAIWDGGWAGLHEDLNESGKLVKGDKGKNCGDYCYVRDHPTHVAGTLLGAGNIQYENRGVAPDTDLVTYVWPGYSFTELFSETNESINKYEAVVSQNSWGVPVDSDNEYTFGDYRLRSVKYDLIIANKTSEVQGTIPVVFSAGNHGNSDFSLRYNTTTGPGGTAKNTITVGAINDNREQAYYSSWGPTDDGRIKPTLVADGGEDTTGDIESTIPSNSSDDDYPYDGMQGTSMAAPAVSGVVVLINEQFNRTYSELPAPSTVKATLIHTAEDLNRTGPDYTTGWGLANAERAIQYVNNSEERHSIKRGVLNDTGDQKSFTVTVPEDESVNLTLVWSDYPASYSSSKTLINDLDLVVKDSDGERKYPWTLSWENRTKPAIQTQKDHTNPVEQVSVSNTSTRKYEVVVNATNLPEPSQSYTLLMSSNSAPVPEINSISPKNTAYGELPDFNVSVNEAVKSVNYSLNGKNYTLEKKNSTFYYNNSVDVEGNKTVTFYAENIDGYTVSKDVSFIVDTTVPLLEIHNPVESANISGEFYLNASWSDETTSVDHRSYELYNSTYSEKGSLNALVNSSKLEDGEYNISFNVSDSLNNSNQKQTTVVVDNKPPSFDFIGLKDGEIRTSGSLTIDAVWSDITTGVENTSFVLENQKQSYSGSLNHTINENNLSNSVYNLTYRIEDYAGNNNSETIELFYDTKPPFLQVISPEKNSLAPVNFSVAAVFNDSVSGIKRANYSIINESKVLSGQLNDTVDTSNLSEGNYAVNFTVYDNAGRINSSIVNFTTDYNPPNLSVSLSQNNGVVSGNFSVNGTYSDDNGIEMATYELSNSSFRSTGGLNATINSSRFGDGFYNLTVAVNDTAGNVNSTVQEINFDNTPPQIKDSLVGENSNISGSVDINFTLEEANLVTASEFRFANSTGNVTSWKQLNYTGFNTSGLSEGEYKITLRLNDSLGNFQERNLTSITVDNTVPELDVKDYNLSFERNGWIKDKKILEVSCSDLRTGVYNISSPYNSTGSSPANFTLRESGKNEYLFRCRDYAGNVDDKSVSFNIDSNKPVLETVSPESGSTTSRTVEITGKFFNESKESGLNFSASSIEVDSGTIDFELSNTSFDATVSGLEYSETFSLEGSLVDRVGHIYEFNKTYEVKAEPEEDTGSGGGSGGSIPSSFQSVEENNASEEITTSNSSVTNDTDDSSADNNSETNVSEVCQLSVADSTDCRVIESCQVPSGWNEVESCSSWEQTRAEELIRQLPAEDEISSEARSQFETGNYSQAIDTALYALDQQTEVQKEKNSSASYSSGYRNISIATGVVLTVAGIVLYRKRREEKNSC